MATAPVKSAERARQKVVNDYDGDASRIKDLARNTIIASEADIPRIVDDLAAAGAKVKEIKAADDMMGYSGFNASIKTQAGIYAEIQVNTAAMILAKESPEIAERLLGAARYGRIAEQAKVPGGLGHKLYEQHRVLEDKASDAARAIASQSRQYYDAVRGRVANNAIATASSGQLADLLPTSTLSQRQAAILQQLSSQGSIGAFSKKIVSMSDLRAISQVTGDEYSMFTRGSQRTVIRGYGNEIYVSKEKLEKILAGNYGKWSGHTHPSGYSVNPGPADRPFLQQMRQQRSAIWGDGGHYTFGQLPSDDAMIHSEIVRKQWARIYGGNQNERRKFDS